LTAVAYKIARGSVAACYPEANVLVAPDQYDAKSGTPSYKSSPVEIQASAVQGRHRPQHKIATMSWPNPDRRAAALSVHRRRAAILSVTQRRPFAKGDIHMCDYSLQHVASRPAEVGDKLVSTSFSNSTTRGFAAAGEPDMAVCLLPGTEIAFEHNVRCDGVFGLFPRNLREKVARFRQVDLDKPHTHHDALEFPGGRCVLVTQLLQGQQATVLQLPAFPHVARVEVDEGRAVETHRHGGFVA